MAYECIDLKGFLFMVFLSIPLTSSANIDCGGKPFHCLNSTHFMICVDLGGGLSTTIDDFVIPCPPTTLCRKDNKFECEFPKIEETTTPLYVSSIPAENKKSALPEIKDNLITIQPPVETTIALMLTEPYTVTKLPTLEETSPFNNEVLENLKEEFASGNEKFFEGDTIKSTTTVSSSYNIDEIKTKRPKIYDITENYNNFKLKSEPVTVNAVETTETSISKLTDNYPSAVVLPTVSTNVLKDNSSIRIDLPSEPSGTYVNDLYKFNETKPNSAPLPLSVDESPMIDKLSVSSNQLDNVVLLQNSTPTTLIETVSENTINVFNHSERIFETTTNYNDRNNIEFLIEPKVKVKKPFIDEHINQNISKVIHSTEIPKKASQHANMTSNQNLLSPIEITTAKLPTTVFNDSEIKKINDANTKDSSDLFLNHNALAKDGNDISAKANTEMNITNVFNDANSNLIISTTNVDLQKKFPDFVTNEVITNDNVSFIDKPSIIEYTTTADFMTSTNFKQPQISKYGTTTFESTIPNSNETSVTESLAHIINDQVIRPANNFNSSLLIENSTTASPLQNFLMNYFTPIKDENLTSFVHINKNYTYEETTQLPINNTIITKNISTEVVEPALSLPAIMKDAVINIIPVPKFTTMAAQNSITDITNDNDFVSARKENNATKTESDIKINLTTIDSNLNDTVLIEPNYWQNSTTLDLNNNTTVNKSHIAVSELPELPTTQGLHNGDNIVINDTFTNYVEDIHTLKSDYRTEYGIKTNISMKVDAGTSLHEGNVTQLENTIHEPIFAVQNVSMYLKRVANVNNILDKQNRTFFTKAVQDMKTNSERVVDSSTFASVIKLQIPEYITESVSLPAMSTEPPLRTATIPVHKKYTYLDHNMLSKNNNQDLVNTKTSKKPIYSNIPNNVVNLMPDIVHDPIFNQVTPLPHKSVTSNILTFNKLKSVINLTEYQNTSNNNLEQAIETPRGVSDTTSSPNMNYTSTNQINNDLKLVSSNTKNLTATTHYINNNISSSFNCLNVTRGNYADNQDCRKFYTCLGKLQPAVRRCPKNTVFSEITKLCTRNLSHCVRNNQFHCVYEGRFNDLIKDNIYYICVKNNSSNFVRYTLRCKNGYHLNKTIVKCQNNTVKWNQSAVSSSDSNIGSNNPDRSLANSDLTEKSNFECEDEGNFPYSKDCRKYYVCTKNTNDEYRLTIQTCASDEMYESKKKKCVSSESEEC